MIIDILALRKICIKEAGIDIGILKSYSSYNSEEGDSTEDHGLAEINRSPGAIKEAKKFLKNLDSLYYNSPKIIESEIIKEFDQNCVSKGGQMIPANTRKKYLGELIKQALEGRKISGQTYNELRGRFVGLKGFSPGFQKRIQQTWRNEYSNPTSDGIYDILEGKENNNNNNAVQFPAQDQNQPLQLAASVVRKSKGETK